MWAGKRKKLLGYLLEVSFPPALGEDVSVRDPAIASQVWGGREEPRGPPSYVAWGRYISKLKAKNLWKHTRVDY